MKNPGNTLKSINNLDNKGQFNNMVTIFVILALFFFFFLMYIILGDPAGIKNQKTLQENFQSNAAEMVFANYLQQIMENDFDGDGEIDTSITMDAMVLGYSNEYARNYFEENTRRMLARIQTDIKYKIEVVYPDNSKLVFGSSFDSYQRKKARTIAIPAPDKKNIIIYIDYENQDEEIQKIANRAARESPI